MTFYVSLFIAETEIRRWIEAGAAGGLRQQYLPQKLNNKVVLLKKY